MEVRPFEFDRDTFAFRNELHWQYLIDEKTGRVTTRKNDPPPTYALRCFVVVRRARQFKFHARFNPKLPPLIPEQYRSFIRGIIRRNCTRPTPPDQRLTIPGYASLREFSSQPAIEKILKQECGGAWQSYVNSRHWRMLVPFSRENQRREADRLAQITHQLPIIHIVRFPQLTINHALLIFDVEKTSEGYDFQIYDPNLPEAPSVLTFNRAEGTFTLPRNIYWAGGRVDVYETYR